MGASKQSNLRGVNRLTDRAVKAFVANAKTGSKFSDGGGLYAERTAGGLSWRIKYRYAGAERRYSMGSIPLAEARAERDRVKALLKEGIDPVAERQRRRMANVTAEIEGMTFVDLADEWFERNKRYWSAVHYDTARQAFKRDVLPTLGKLSVKSVTPVMITPVVEAIVRRGSDETARRVLQHIRKVFQFGVGKGVIATNPAAATHEVLPPTRVINHRPAILDLDSVARKGSWRRRSGAMHRGDEDGFPPDRVLRVPHRSGGRSSVAGVRSRFARRDVDHSAGKAKEEGPTARPRRVLWPALRGRTARVEAPHWPLRLSVFGHAGPRLSLSGRARKIL